MTDRAPTPTRRRDPTGDAAPDWLRRAALGVVALAPLALGGAHPWADVAVWSVVMAIFAAHSLQAARQRSARTIPVASVVLGIVAVGTLLRATPAGAALASTPVREAWELWPELTPRGVAAPALAALAALRLAGLAAALSLGASMFASRADRLALGAAVLTGAASSAVVGVLQQLSGSSRVLFIYEPAQVERAIHALSGPFVNPNQAGALGALAALLAAFGSMRILDGVPRILLSGAALGLASWTLTLNAGAAVVGLLAGAVVLLAGDFAHRLGADNPAARLASALAAAALLCVPVVAFTPLREMFGFLAAPSQLAKAANWAEALSLIQDAPVLGHGAGAWVDLAPGALSETATLRRAHVESAPLQLAIEHGLLALIALLGALATDLLPWLLGRGGAMSVRWRVLAAALLTTIGLEYALGLGHQAAGVALPVALLVGALVGTARSQRRRAAGTSARPLPRAAALVLDAALLATAGAALAGVGAGVAARLGGPEREAAALAAGSTTSELETSVARLAQTAPMNPAVVALGVALAELEAQPALADRRLAWLHTHAPSYGGTWGAALHVAHGRGDAAQVCEATRRLLELGIRQVDLAPITRDAAVGLACLPSSEAVRQRVFDQLLRDGQALQLLLLTGELLQREPDSAAALEAAAKAALAARLPQGAAYYAADLRRVRPEAATGWLLGAQALRATSRRSALDLLSEGLSLHPADTASLLLRAELLVEGAETGEAEEDWVARLRADLDAATPGVAQRPAQQRTHAVLRARAALAQGDPRRAASILETLLERNPNDVYTVRLRARAAGAAGDGRGAAYWWQRLLELAPEDAEAARALSER